MLWDTAGCSETQQIHIADRILLKEDKGDRKSQKLLSNLEIPLKSFCSSGNKDSPSDQDRDSSASVKGSWDNFFTKIQGSCTLILTAKNRSTF